MCILLHKNFVKTFGPQDCLHGNERPVAYTIEDLIFHMGLDGE